MTTLIQTVLIPILLSQLNPAAFTYQPRVVRTIGSTTEATCLVAFDGELWAGTLGGGLVRLDGSGDSLTTRDGLPGNRVNDCLLHDDVVWVATDAGLASLGADGEWFDTAEWGRFLRLADAGENFVAARDDGMILVYGEDDNPDSPTRIQLDMIPLSLAGHPAGGWAAGGIGGKVYQSAGGYWVQLGFPVTALAWHKDELRALIPGQGFTIAGQQVIAAPSLNQAATLTRAGMPVTAGQLTRTRVVAASHHDNRLYVATDSGVFEQRDDKWLRIALGGCPCGPRLSALASFRNELWVGGFDSGLCRFDGTHWHHYQGNGHLPSDMINHLATGRGRLYVATLKGLVIIDSKLKFSRFTRDQCVGNPRNNCPFYESVTGVAEDRSTANVWIADTGSIHRFSSRKWRHFYRARGITSEHITRIAADRNRIAVGTSDKGLLLFDNGSSFRILDDSTGLGDNWIMDLSFDRSGALWIATCTRGVSRYDRGTWQSWTTRDGLTDDYALSIADIEGRIWIGHFRGLSILSETGIVNLSIKDGLAGNEVHSILEHEGKIYLATDGGLTILETV